MRVLYHGFAFAHIAHLSTHVLPLEDPSEEALQQTQEQPWPVMCEARQQSGWQVHPRLLNRLELVIHVLGRMKKIQNAHGLGTMQIQEARHSVGPIGHTTHLFGLAHPLIFHTLKTHHLSSEHGRCG